MKFAKINISKYSIVTIALIALYTVIMGVVCHIKYNNFGYDDFDLAIHTQSLAAILAGQSQTSILGIPFLGNHMVLILYLIAPFYALIHSPLLLLYLQSFVLALGAWAVFALARKLLSERWGVALAFAYLIYPPLLYMNLYEFHPVALTTTGLLFAMLAFKNGYFVRFMVMMLLCMSCQENIPLIAVGFGVFAIFERKRWWWAVIPFVTGFIYFAIVVQVIMPRLNNTMNFMMLYGHLGNSMPEIAKNIIIHPIKAIAFMVQPSKISFINALLAPLAYLSLLSPLSWIPAGLVLLQRLLSERGSESVIIYHYQAEFIPFVFVSAIYGIRRLLKFKIRILNLLAALSIGLFPIIGISLSGLFPLIKYNVCPAKSLKPLIHAEHKVLKTVPKDATVATTFEYLAPLSDHLNLHSIHHIASGHYTLSAKPYPIPTDLSFIIIDTNDRLTFSPTGFYTPFAYQNLQAMLKTGNWQLAAEEESMLALQRSEVADSRLPLAQTVVNIPNSASTNVTQTGVATFNLKAFELIPEKDSKFSIINLFWKTGSTPSTDADMLLVVDSPKMEPYGVILSPGSRFWPPQSWATNAFIRDRHRIPIQANTGVSVKVKMLQMTLR